MKNPSRPRANRWVTGVKLFVSVAVLLVLVLLVDWSALRYLHDDLTLGKVVFVLALIPVSMGLRAVRLWVLLGRAMPFGAAVRMTLVGETLNIFLPASTGDLAKAYYGVRENGKKELVVTATIIDKATGLLGLLLLGAAAAAVQGYTVLVVVFGSVGILETLFILRPNLIPWRVLERILERLRPGSIDVNEIKAVFRGKRMPAIFAIVLSIVAWVCSFIQLMAIAALFGIRFSPAFLMSVAPLMNLSRLFPFAFAGLGVQEGVAISVFSLAEVPSAIAVAISLTATVATTIIPGIVGLFYFLRMRSA